MIGADLDWPASVPTVAVLAALTHANDHQHKGVPDTVHFLGALREEIGLDKRQTKVGA